MDKSFWLTVKSQFLEFVLDHGPSILYAVIAFVIGIFLIKFLMRVLQRILKKSRVELSLKTFIESLSVLLLYGVLAFIVGSIIGIKSSSFLAIFGAASIAIGLALQGSLANFAGGVLILVFKPFKVGDLIHVNSNLGFVQKIDVLYTHIKTYDGRAITMPNGRVSNSDIDNRTMEPYRRVGLELKVSFDVAIDELRELIIETMNKHPKINKDLPVDAWFDSVGEYELKIIARCWVKSEDYYPTYWEQLEAVKKALDKHGIQMPIPKRALYQMDPAEKEKQTS